MATTKSEWLGLTGSLLIILSLLTLLPTICDVAVFRMIDFPCQAGLSPRPDVQSDTRIAYCVSRWPRPPASGGDIYAVGSSNQAEVTIGYATAVPGTLTLKRQGQILFVDGQPLQSQETYEGFRWRLSLNPWLLLTARIVVTNEGTAQTIDGGPSDAIFAAGDVYEGWLPGPIGLSALVAGIWLIRREKRKRPA